jgi:pimeloyl-ACP methyl ester carboxylesterase
MHVFGECGHCPQYEEPEAFIAIIEDWLAANQ